MRCGDSPPVATADPPVGVVNGAADAVEPRSASDPDAPSSTRRSAAASGDAGRDTEADYFLRWRILARIRRFLRPTLRRPLPVFLEPNGQILGVKWMSKMETANRNYQAKCENALLASAMRWVFSRLVYATPSFL